MFDYQHFKGRAIFHPQLLDLDNQLPHKDDFWLTHGKGLLKTMLKKEKMLDNQLPHNNDF